MNASVPYELIILHYGDYILREREIKIFQDFKIVIGDGKTKLKDLKVGVIPMLIKD